MNTYLIVALTLGAFIIIILVQILRYGNYSVESTNKYLYKKMEYWIIVVKNLILITLIP